MRNTKSIFFIIVANICFSCSHKTELKSDQLNDKSERIDILSDEVKLFSEIQNAEFDLFNVNGFSDDFLVFPGASSTYYEFVVKLNQNDIEKWREDLIETNGNIEDEKWIFDLIKIRQNEWIINSKPKFYTRNGEYGVKIIIFEKEGIVFKSINQQ